MPKLLSARGSAVARESEATKNSMLLAVQRREAQVGAEGRLLNPASSKQIQTLLFGGSANQKTGEVLETEREFDVDLPEEELDSKAGVVAGEAARISQFYSLLTSSIDVIYKFCDRIPGFNDLCKQDRELLFRYERLLGNP